MNKRNMFKILVAMVLVGFVISWSATFKVMADSANSGTGSGSGGVKTDGTGMFVSNVYGATWRYYPWGESGAGISFTSDTTATIEGWSGSGGFHVSGAHVSCPTGTRGLWRYSFVAQKSLGQYSAGDLVGVIGIDGNSREFNSRMLGGDMNYIGSNWGQVEQEYLTLYNAGLVSIPWGGGSGLSWFCSSTETPVTPPNNLTCSTKGLVGDNYGETTMTTKVMNERFNSWVENGTVYAMPTDPVKWYHCYAAGVQSMYGKGGETLRKATVVGVSEVDYDASSGSYVHHKPHYFDSEWPYVSSSGYCNSYSHTWEYGYSGSTTMAKQWSWDNWSNYWTLENGGVPIAWATGDSAGSYANGTVVSKRRDEGFTVNKTSNVGGIFTERTFTGAPTLFKIDNNGKHGGWTGSGNYQCLVKEFDHNVYGLSEDQQKYCSGLNEAGDATLCHGADGSSWWEGLSVVDVVYKDVLTIDYFENLHDSDYTVGTLNPSNDSGFGTVIVPYNYINSVGISISATNNEGLAYAGDTLRIDNAWAKIGARWNDLTKNNYATIVRNGKVQLVSYVTRDPDQSLGTDGNNLCGALDVGNKLARLENGKPMCEVKTLREGDLNADGNLGGVREDFEDITGVHMVPDANAGEYICYAMAVYPANSGGPDNTNPKGSDSWEISGQQCLKIAKKPFFGVLGGGIYSNVPISTSSMGKTNILWQKGYDMSVKNPAKVYFGSFAEQSIYGIDSISGIASGSAYQGNKGISNNDFCGNLVPLTFANAGTKFCGSSRTAGHMGDTGVVDVDRASYVDFWLRSSLDTGEDGPTDGLGATKKFYSNTGKNIYYTNTNDRIIVGNTVEILNGTTRLVKVNNDIEIRANIVYPQSGDKISSAGDIPQAIIYANNVYIGCNVTRIDAILIANKVVNTCVGYTGANYAPAANPLTIRGVIISDGLNLYRTYGAAIDGYSGTPAELVNYDTSTVLWARYMAGASESNTMTEVYRTELAPRY